MNLVEIAEPPGSAVEGDIYADTDNLLYYYSGGGWSSLIDTDTTYSCGNGCDETSETITVAAGAGLDQESSGLKVEPDGITDTELAFDTGQHLTTTSGPTFTDINLTGNLNATTITVGCITFTSGGQIGSDC